MIKYLLLVTLFILSLQVTAQTNIKLIFKNGGQALKDTVDIMDLSQQEFHTLPVKDTLDFSFNKKEIDCYTIRYHTGGKVRWCQVWLNPQDNSIIMRAEKGLPVIDSVINSPMYDYTMQFSHNFRNIKKSDTAAINDYYLNEIQRNIDNVFSYVVANLYLQFNQNSRLDLLNLKAILDKQGTRFGWFFFYAPVNDRLNNLLSVNKISITDNLFYDKRKKKRKMILGNADYFVLDFWFLACPPCIADHKEINTAVKKMDEKRIKVISVSIDNPDKYKEWAAYLTKNNYQWSNYMDDNTIAGLHNKLALRAFPTYIIVNKAGDITGSYDSFSTVLKRLEVN